MLVRAAFHLAGVESAHEPTLRKAVAYLDAKCGMAGVRKHHAAGIRARYGKDHTFSRSDPDDVWPSRDSSRWN